VELTPVGILCNLACTYCYEHPMRDAGGYRPNYDLEKMIAGLDREGGKFSIFGGEPLLTDIDTLEKLFEYGFKKYKSNGIQTNGTLITDKHIDLFVKYNVHVGMSVDGPYELNLGRWAGSIEETNRRTAMSMLAAEKLCSIGRPPSFIITLHKLNSTPEKLPKLKQWFREMDDKGVCSCRLHPLEIEYDSVGDKMGMPGKRVAEVMLEFSELEKELKNLKFDMFGDVKQMLLGEDDSTTCTFHSCDPYTTDAVRGVSGQGESLSCGRNAKEGISFIKAEQHGYERQMALYLTPQEYNGCKGCRFFSMCKAQCPGTGIMQDWRNKTEACEMYYTLFEHFEKEYESNGILPLSKSPDLKEVELSLWEQWAKNQKGLIQNGAFKILRGQKPNCDRNSSHGDHFDSVQKSTK